MRVWIKQHHNELIDSYRIGIARLDKCEGRVIIVCPETDNVLIDCPTSFFNREIEAGRIVGNKFLSVMH